MALSFYNCGAYLAFIFHSFHIKEQGWPWGNFDSVVFVIAPLLALVGAFAAATILVLTKYIAKRIVWLHYYLLALGSVLLLVSGILLVTNRGETGRRTANDSTRDNTSDNSIVSQHTTKVRHWVALDMAWCTSPVCRTSTLGRAQISTE